MVKSLTIKLMEYNIAMEIKRHSLLLDNLYSKLELIEKKISEPVKLLDDFDVMRLLGISQRTLATYRKQGIVKYLKISGSVRYTKSAIDELINLNQVKRKKV